MNLRLVFTLLTLLTLFCCGSPGQKNAIKIQDENSKVTSGDSSLQTGWYYLSDANNGYRRQLDRDTAYYFLNPVPIVTVDNITTMEIYESNHGGIGLSMQLDEVGTDLWSVATDKTTGEYLAFVLNDKLLHVPRVNSQITVGMTALNRGNYTRQELDEFKKQIEKERRYLISTREK